MTDREEVLWGRLQTIIGAYWYQALGHTLDDEEILVDDHPDDDADDEFDPLDPPYPDEPVWSSLYLKKEPDSAAAAVVLQAMSLQVQLLLGHRQ